MKARPTRSAEEREAARLERERRRAARQGRPMPPSPASAERTPPKPEPMEPEPEPEPKSLQPDPPEPEPLEPKFLQPEPLEPEPVEPELAQPVPQPLQFAAAAATEAEPEASLPGLAPEPEEDEAAHLIDSEPEEEEPLHPVDSESEESPAGTKRVSGLERTPTRRPGGTARRPPRLRPRPRGSRISRGGRSLALVAIVLAVAVIWFLAQLFQPFHGAGGARVRVVIPRHLTSSQIGDLLARDGIVSSSFFFELRATLAAERGSLRSGTYNLQRDMSYGAALTILTRAPPAARVSELTITEGQTRQQTDAILRRQGIRGSYLAATRSSRLLRPVALGAPPRLSSLEGFLFPSTYQLRDPITARALVDDQLTAFKRAFAGVDLTFARRQHLTPYEVLTIASVIQGEARTGRDRALVSSVIFNRLRAKMRLQMDDTVRYATGNRTAPITVSQLASRSPWNTYTHSGLPPTPIDSPGLASIQAAAHPASTGYLFFVVKPCGNGEHAFASSYAQFLTLQSHYNLARARRGGRSPEFCR